MATRSLPPYFTHIVKFKFAHPHPLIILTKHVCHHNSFWGSRCDSNHAPTISLKLVHFQGDFGIPLRLMTQVLSKHTSSLTSDHPRYFESFRPYFLWNLISANPFQNNSFQACNSKYFKRQPNVQKFSTMSTMVHKVSDLTLLNVFGGRGLPAWPPSPTGVNFHGNLVCNVVRFERTRNDDSRILDVLEVLWVPCMQVHMVQFRRILIIIKLRRLKSTRAGACIIQILQELELEPHYWKSKALGEFQIES